MNHFNIIKGVKLSLILQYQKYINAYYYVNISIATLLPKVLRVTIRIYKKHRSILNEF